MDGQRIARGHGIRRRNRDWLSVAKPVSRIVRPSITAVTVPLGVTVAVSSAFLICETRGLCLGQHIVARLSALPERPRVRYALDFGPAAVLDYGSKRISVHRANRFSRDQLRRTIINRKVLSLFHFYLNRLRLYGQHAVFVM